MPLLPLSPSQRIFRHWEQLYPQNSAQALLIEGSPDSELIESCFQSTLRDLGLGRIHFSDDEPGYSHEIWSGDPQPPLVSYRSDGVALFPFLQAQINLPFPAIPNLPYRPFALQHSTGCYLGMIYQQWVADSVSIRILLREWLTRILNPTKARRKLIDLPRTRIARGPGIGTSIKQLSRGVRTLTRWISDARQLCTFPPVQPKAPSDTPLLLRSFSISGDHLERLLMVTRAEGFTFSDLLLAATAKTIQHHLPNSSNPRLAIATSIDLRPYLPGDLSETFGHLLSFAPIQCQMASSNPLDLAQDIARQTRRLKDPERLGQKLAITRALALAARYLPPQRFTEFHRRRAPIAAALANVNLNKTWVALQHPSPIREWYRFAAPNPGVPLTICSSTLGDTTTFMLGCCRTSIDDATADTLPKTFANTLDALIPSTV